MYNSKKPKYLVIKFPEKINIHDMFEYVQQAEIIKTSKMDTTL